MKPRHAELAMWKLRHYPEAQGGFCFPRRNEDSGINSPLAWQEPGFSGEMLVCYASVPAEVRTWATSRFGKQPL